MISMIKAHPERPKTYASRYMALWTENGEIQRTCYYDHLSQDWKEEIGLVVVELATNKVVYRQGDTFKLEVLWAREAKGTCVCNTPE